MQIPRLPLIVSIASTLMFVGCATAPSAPSAPIQTTRTFAMPLDKVWGAVVSEISADCPIQSVDKASGLITSQMMSFGGGFGGYKTLQQYAYEPKAFLATYTGGARGSLTFFVNSNDGANTTVRATARFEGFEDNVSKSWQPWQSNGALEQKYLNKIAAVLGQ